MNPKLNTAIFTGTDNCLLYLNDGDYAEGNNLVDIQVKSGDYFATLATRLDQLRVATGTLDGADKANLENIIDDLIYLQKSYRIVKK